MSRSGTKRLQRIYKIGLEHGRWSRKNGAGLEDEIRIPYSSEGFGVGRRSGIELWHRGWWKGFMEGET